MLQFTPEAYERARRKLVEGDEAKRFIPFYRNTLKPVLHEAIIRLLSDRKNRGERELLALAEYAKLVEDMETILKRVVLQGENAEKVIGEVLKNAV